MWTPDCWVCITPASDDHLKRVTGVIPGLFWQSHMYIMTRHHSELEVIEFRRDPNILIVQLTRCDHSVVVTCDY